VVDGSVHIRIFVDFPVEAGKLSTAMGGLTAYPVISAVPGLCAATPGIKRSTDLPVIVPQIPHLIG
jgi:hypothetical protein